MWLLTLLAACDSGGGESSPDSEAATCQPLRMEQAATWGEEELLVEDPPEGEGANPGVGLGDFDGDGWLDAFVVSPSGSLLLHNDGAGGLSADGALLVDGGRPPRAKGVAVGDLDGDGDLDAWLGRWTGHDDLLLFNDGAGRFSAQELPDSEGESNTGALADLDGDGDLDLFVAAYASEVGPESIVDGSAVGTGNRLWLQQDGAWVEAAVPAEAVDDLSFLAVPFDPDQDGDLDLFLANDYGPFLGRDRLLRNDGAGGLTLGDDCACDLASFHMGAAVGDFDGSGSPDLYLTDLAGPDLLLNDGTGAFYDASYSMDASIPNASDRLASWGTAAVDLDRDGWEDLPMVFGSLMPGGDQDSLSVLGDRYDDWIDGPAQRDAILLNVEGGYFLDVSSEVGFEDAGVGRALAVGDLDNDGDPDLLTAGLWSVQDWRTEGGCSQGVKLRLADEGLRLGVGAEVIATVDGRDLHRWITPTSTWSSHAPELVVGLGEAEQIETLRVRWLDGSTSSWSNLAAGETVDIRP